MKLPSEFIWEYRSVVFIGSGRGLPFPPSSSDDAGLLWSGRGLLRRGTPGARRLPSGRSLRGCSG